MMAYPQFGYTACPTAASSLASSQVFIFISYVYLFALHVEMKPFCSGRIHCVKEQSSVVRFNSNDDWLPNQYPHIYT